MSNFVLLVHNGLFVVFILLGLFILAAGVKSLFTKKKMPC